MPIVPKKKESAPKIITIYKKSETQKEIKKWKEALTEWYNLQYNKEARIKGFEKILENVLKCNKIKETETMELYKCTFKITPKDVPQLRKPKIHSFDVFISKTTGKAIVEKGNLPEPLPVTEPLDLLNAYYIVVEWNKLRDFAMWYSPSEFEKSEKEIWKNFEKEMKEEGVPVSFLERKRLGASRYYPDKVLRTVAEKTGQSEKEIIEKLEEIPKEIEEKMKKAPMTVEELLKQFKV